MKGFPTLLAVQVDRSHSANYLFFFNFCVSRYSCKNVYYYYVSYLQCRSAENVAVFRENYHLKRLREREN